jgi:hypothetical protein
LELHILCFLSMRKSYNIFVNSKYAFP